MTKEEIFIKAASNHDEKLTKLMQPSTMDVIYEAMEEYAQQSNPETVKTVNPHGYLMNGRYVSFEDMKGLIVSEIDETTPLYTVALWKSQQLKESVGDDKFKEGDSVLIYKDLVDKCIENVKRCTNELAKREVFEPQTLEPKEQIKDLSGNGNHGVLNVEPKEE